jgi:hypothetical protein
VRLEGRIDDRQSEHLVAIERGQQNGAIPHEVSTDLDLVSDAEETIIFGVPRRDIHHGDPFLAQVAGDHAVFDLDVLRPVDGGN